MVLKCHYTMKGKCIKITQYGNQEKSLFEPFLFLFSHTHTTYTTQKNINGSIPSLSISPTSLSPFVSPNFKLAVLCRLQSCSLLCDVLISPFKKICFWELSIGLGNLEFIIFLYLFVICRLRHLCNHFN